MRLKSTLLAAFTLLSLAATAQDKIYKKNGDVIDGKVKEVNTRSISYKRADNADGPDYVIGRGEVEKIKYQNGTEDYMDERSRESRTTTSRKPAPKVDYGNNILSLALLNFNDEGYGFGMAYERLLDKNGVVSFYLPVNVTIGNLNGANQVYNPATGSYSYNTLKRTIYQVMPGVKFYPTGNKGKVRYAIGALLDYETGTKDQEQGMYDPLLGGYYSKLVSSDIQKFGIMVSNSLNMYPSPHLFLGIDLGLGLTYMNQKQDFTQIGAPMVEMGTTQLAQFNFRLGYRF